MSIEEVKELITTAQARERVCKQLQHEIERRREELASIKSALGGAVHVSGGCARSPQERIYEKLEELYIQLCEILEKQTDSRKQLEKAVNELNPIEQEIVRAWISGKTEEQIGEAVGYSRPTIARYKRRVLIKLSEIAKTRKVDTP